MTRKDYILIADAIRRALDAATEAPNERHGQVAHTGIKLAAGSIADALAADNARFDRDRFMRAALGDK